MSEADLSVLSGALRCIVPWWSKVAEEVFCRCWMVSAGTGRNMLARFIGLFLERVLRWPWSRLRCGFCLNAYSATLEMQRCWTRFFSMSIICRKSRMRQRMACWGLRCFCAKSCGEKCRAERLKALFSTRDGRRRTYRKKMVWEKMLYLLLWLQIQSFLIIWWLRLRCGEARQQVWRGACLIWCNVLRHKPTT